MCCQSNVCRSRARRKVLRRDTHANAESGAARTSREGISFPIHVSMSPCRTSYRGEMTPHLFNLRTAASHSVKGCGSTMHAVTQICSRQGPSC